MVNVTIGETAIHPIDKKTGEAYVLSCKLGTKSACDCTVAYRKKKGAKSTKKSCSKTLKPISKKGGQLICSVYVAPLNGKPSNPYCVHSKKPSKPPKAPKFVKGWLNIPILEFPLLNVHADFADLTPDSSNSSTVRPAGVQS